MGGMASNSLQVSPLTEPITPPSASLWLYGAWHAVFLRPCHMPPSTSTLQARPVPLLFCCYRTACTSHVGSLLAS